jgi:hypothetical protein
MSVGDACYTMFLYLIFVVELCIIFMYLIISMLQRSFPTSVRLNRDNKLFLQFIARSQKSSESELINRALDLYRQYKLSCEMVEEAEEDLERDKVIANEDFSSYSKIVHETEAI